MAHRPTPNLRKRTDFIFAPAFATGCENKRPAPKGKSVCANALKRICPVGAPLSHPLTLGAIAAASGLLLLAGRQP
jgi:hypothetical protein